MSMSWTPQVSARHMRTTAVSLYALNMNFEGRRFCVACFLHVFSSAFLSLKIERRFWGFLSRASGASHTSNGACFVFRCCVFIAHRATSQQSDARTHGRKNWQLTAACNGLIVLGCFGRPASNVKRGARFSRHARSQKGRLNREEYK